MARKSPQEVAWDAKPSAMREDERIDRELVARHGLPIGNRLPYGRRWVFVWERGKHVTFQGVEQPDGRLEYLPFQQGRQVGWRRYYEVYDPRPCRRGHKATTVWAAEGRRTRCLTCDRDRQAEFRRYNEFIATVAAEVGFSRAPQETPAAFRRRFESYMSQSPYGDGWRAAFRPAD